MDNIKKINKKTLQWTLASVALSIVMAIVAVLITFYDPSSRAMAAAPYVYNTEIMATPYWNNVNGNYTTVTNEIVMPILYTKNRSGGNVSTSTAVGFLAYNPYEIIDIRDYSLNSSLSWRLSSSPNNNEPIVVDASTGKIEVNTSVYPNYYLKDEWLDGKNLPAGISTMAIDYSDGGGTNGGKLNISEDFKVRNSHLCVSYTYDSSAQNLGFTAPAYDPTSFNSIISKLTSATPVNICIFGDSISFGSSASALNNFAPYTPCWFNIIEQELERRYYDGSSSGVTITNYSAGGAASTWGVWQVYNVLSDAQLSGFDLVCIGWGTNDTSMNHNVDVVKNNIISILTKFRSLNPNADFVIVKPFTQNPMTTWTGTMPALAPKYDEIAVEYDLPEFGSGCGLADLYTIGNAILALKQTKMTNNTNYDTRYQYEDISANYINHPNDYMVRLYAGAILSLFVDFS